MRKFGFGFAVAAMLSLTSLAVVASEKVPVGKVVVGAPAVVQVGSLVPAVTPASPTVSGETRFYTCDHSFTPPKCYRVNDPVQQAPLAEDVEDIDWATVLAVNRAARSGVDTPILPPDGTGPIEACGGGHGQSACCKKTTTQTNPPRTTYECGEL